MNEFKGFFMSLETAIKFFKRCKERGAETLAEKEAVMLELVHEEDIRILNEMRLKKLLQGKKVLRIKPK
jgi:hypothetical protein